MLYSKFNKKKFKLFILLTKFLHKYALKIRKGHKSFRQFYIVLEHLISLNLLI